MLATLPYTLTQYQCLAAVYNNFVPHHTDWSDMNSSSVLMFPANHSVILVSTRVAWFESSVAERRASASDLWFRRSVPPQHAASPSLRVMFGKKEVRCIPVTDSVLLPI